MGLEDEIRAARQQRQSEQASFAQHAATTRRDVERAIEKARPDILECFQQMKRHKAAKAVSVGLAPFGAKAYILGEFAVDDKGNLLCMELRVPNRRVLSKTKSLDEFMRTRTLIMWEGKLTYARQMREGGELLELIPYLRQMVIARCAKA